MRRIISIIVFMLIFPAVLWGDEQGKVRLSLVKGDIQVYTEDTGEWVAASINMPLDEGDRLWSPSGGRGELHIQGGIYLRLDAATALDIVDLKDDSLRFHLGSGRAYVNNRQGGVDHIQVETPLASISCYDNSLIIVAVTTEGGTELSVIKGYAQVETGRGGTRVTAGKTLITRNDLSAELSPISPPDAWEKWNRKRDKKVEAATESLRYLPDELDEYSADLDENGRWVYSSDYGYVWTPSVAISFDWAPYRSGRWMWERGNYVWIAYEPWGWAPYHYGRWASISGIGWCWVPPRRHEVYWGPGYVGWVYGSDYVAWVPLAPGEIFYGYGNFGPASVNITNITINRTSIHQDFRNGRHLNAVTVVKRESFVRGRRPEVVKVRENPFQRKDAVLGPPVLKPQERVSRPVIRKIPESRRPPENIIRNRLPEIRQERRLRRTVDEPVMKQGEKAKEMPVIQRREPRPLPRGVGKREDIRKPSPVGSQRKDNVRSVAPRVTEPAGVRVAPQQQDRQERGPAAKPESRERGATPEQQREHHKGKGDRD